MKLRTLASALVIAGLSVGVAQASGTPAGLTKAEKSAFSLLESLFSATAAAIEANIGGCAAMAFGYNVEANAFSNGDGTARIGRFFVETWGQPFDVRGDLFDVEQVDSPGDINLVDVADYVALYGWDSSGSIMWASADMTVNWDPYDQHIIKDFWDNTDEGEHQVKKVLDAGLEVITKLDYPRSKWFQWSDYTREDGVEGIITWTKTQIAPYGGDLCNMLFTGDVDLQGHGFQLFHGRLIISALLER
jgi:hypothetical protein